MARNGQDWMVFSSHGQVLVYLALYPEATMRQVSDALDLTERHVSRMIQDLEAGGVLTVRRGGPGRRNTYGVNPDAPLRHPALAHLTVGHLLQTLAQEPPEPQEPAAATAADAGRGSASERVTP